MSDDLTFTLTIWWTSRQSRDQICSKQNSLDSSNSLRIRIWRNFFKVKPVISWNGQNSFQRIIPSNSRHFTTLQPWGLSLVHFSFEKRRSNIWGIYESTPQPQGMNKGTGFPEIWDFRDLRFLRESSENEDFFPRANLILLPASGAR